MYVNEKQLMEKKKVQRHAWRFEDGSDVEMSWNLYMPGVGNAVVVQTGATPNSANLSKNASNITIFLPIFSD